MEQDVSGEPTIIAWTSMESLLAEHTESSPVKVLPQFSV